MSESTAIVFPPGQIATVNKANPSTRPVVWIGSALLVAELLGGTTSYSVPATANMPTTALQQWTNSGTVEGFISTRSAALASSPTFPQSLQETVIALRDLSGLTWDQLARLFGVSRRAVHLWASGGRMNSYHAERLNQIVTIVRSVQARSNQQQLREILLAPSPDGRSLYEALLAERAVSRGVNAPSFPPEQLTEALHDRPTD